MSKGNLALAGAAVALASPFAADPVGTKRSQRDFADDPVNPTRVIDPYVGHIASALHQLFGVSILSDRASEAAVSMGYDPMRAFLAFSDVTGTIGQHKDENGFTVVDDPEELNRTTNEVWAAFWNVDGNDPDPEIGGIDDTQVTLVRLI